MISIFYTKFVIKVIKISKIASVSLSKEKILYFIDILLLENIRYREFIK